MKKIPLLSIVLLLSFASRAQFVARMEVKGDLPGVCDIHNVYALFPGFKGQEEAKPPMSKTELEKKLNSEVEWLKANPKFKGKMMMNLIINCSGEMIRCEVDNKSGKDDLDREVLEIFQQLKKWAPGKLDGNDVDTSVLYSLTIKKGVIKVE
ncbi:MAG TPA: energy transducer TonB [Bacteroidia bacterium]|jgi:TonB family protein